MNFCMTNMVPALLLACATVVVACTPAKLDEAKVTGSDTTQDVADAGATDAAAGSDAGADAGADADATADTGVGPDAISGDLAGACGSPADCPKPDQCQQATCVGGQCGTAPLASGKCDDGEPCTLGDSCQAGVCKPGSGWDLVACACHPDPAYARGCPDDGDLCNGQQVCTKNASGYACKAGPVPAACADSDSTDCVTSTYDPKTGQCVKANLKKGSTCSAGFPTAWECVVNQQCDGQGKCDFQNNCECMEDSECSAKDDDSLCNGKLFCNKDPKASGPKCQVNPKSVVSCSASNDTACLKNACTKATGKCAMSPAEGVKQVCDDKSGQCWWYPLEPTDVKPALVSCNDGLGCTLNDECKAGKCIGQTDACACKTDAECQGIEPWLSLNDRCRGKPYCDKSNSASPVCKLNPATVPQCSAGLDTTCAKNVCAPYSGKCESRPRSQVYKRKCGDDPAKGCSECADDDPSCVWAVLPTSQAPWTGYDKLKCDDGNACTANESCLGGQCLATNWLCSCAKDADCADDDNLCSGTPYCEKASGKCKTNPASVVACSPANDTDCAKNSCDDRQVPAQACVRHQCGLQ